MHCDGKEKNHTLYIENGVHNMKIETLGNSDVKIYSISIVGSSNGLYSYCRKCPQVIASCRAI